MHRAAKDLKTAESVIPIDLTWGFAIAYHAMIRAGKVLMLSRGFLPTAKNSHKTIMEFTGFVLGDEYQYLVLRFNRMRRKRHDFIYDSQNHTTVSEATGALNTAKEWIDKIADLIIGGTDEMSKKQAFLDSMNKGSDNANAGKLFDTEAVKAELEKKRKRE